jgi:hypothetical protein
MYDHRGRVREHFDEFLRSTLRPRSSYLSKGNRSHRAKLERFDPCIETRNAKLNGLVDQADREMADDRAKSIKPVAPDKEHDGDRTSPFTLR